MTFETLVEEAVQLIGDICIFNEGECIGCELKEFCACSKPMDYTVEDV